MFLRLVVLTDHVALLAFTSSKEVCCGLATMYCMA